LLFSIATLFSYNHIHEQPTWKYLTQDISKALQTDQFPNWKYADRKKDVELGVVKNDYDVVVSSTTYERVAWFKEGIKLIPKYPLGFGLIEDSFQYLALKEWPDSDLKHTHSGWVDLALAFGIPGVLLLFLAIVVAFFQCLRSENYYARSGIWTLPIITFVFLTSELCEKLSFEFFIFAIVFYGVVSLPIKKYQPPNY
jgi:hypothetical protein